MTDETADAVFRRLYVCDDPACTASHVDLDTLPPSAIFTETPPEPTP